MSLVNCSYEYCNDDGHDPRCVVYQQGEYRVKYNERRALRIIIILFVVMILIMLGGVFMLGASV